MGRLLSGLSSLAHRGRRSSATLLAELITAAVLAPILAAFFLWSARTYHDRQETMVAQ